MLVATLPKHPRTEVVIVSSRAKVSASLGSKFRDGVNRSSGERLSALKEERHVSEHLNSIPISRHGGLC